jgi:hypothetical protein
MACPLCVRSYNVSLVNLTINIDMPFVFVTEIHYVLCEVGSKSHTFLRYRFRISHHQTTFDSLIVLM